MDKPTQGVRGRELQFAALAITVVVAASLVGQFATFPNLAPWYAGLVKPSFNPPNWVFGPVWTKLYAMMAFALWRILRLPYSRSRQLALSLFFVQLGLNMAWSWMFFGAHNPLLGIINIFPQVVAVVAAAAVLYRLDKVAG
jgi:benzodiazapine receptor